MPVSCFNQGLDYTWGDISTKELSTHWLTLGQGTPQSDSCQVKGCVGSNAADISVLLPPPSPGSDTEAELWALNYSVCLKYEASDGGVCVPDSG